MAVAIVLLMVLLMAVGASVTGASAVLISRGDGSPGATFGVTGGAILVAIGIAMMAVHLRAERLLRRQPTADAIV